MVKVVPVGPDDRKYTVPAWIARYMGGKHKHKHTVKGMYMVYGKNVTDRLRPKSNEETMRQEGSLLSMVFFYSPFLSVAEFCFLFSSDYYESLVKKRPPSSRGNCNEGSKKPTGV